MGRRRSADRRGSSRLYRCARIGSESCRSLGRRYCDDGSPSLIGRATASLVPEAVFLPLPETDASHGIQSAMDQIGPVAAKCRAMVVGPGLSRDEIATALLAALFGEARHAAARPLGFGALRPQPGSEHAGALIGHSLPAVIDADALHWLSGREGWWDNVEPRSLLLTPHVGEFAALTGIGNDEILADPTAAVRQAANRWQQTVVLKAGKAWISDGATVRTTESAAPALATAGSGDVLSGSIGAFLARARASRRGHARRLCWRSGRTPSLGRVFDPRGCRKRPSTSNCHCSCRSRSRKRSEPMSQENVPVTSIMRTKIPMVSPDDTINTVAAMIANNDVPGVLVVEDGTLLGIITESDIVTRKATVDFPETVSFLGGYFRAGRLQLPWNRQTRDDASDFDHEIRRVLATSARELMTSPVINIDDDATVPDLATIMIDHNVNPVPVVTDENRIVGIVTRKDLVKFIAGEQGAPSESD